MAKDEGIEVTETTVWHRGRSRTFKDEDKAKVWLKKIEKANEEHRFVDKETQ